MKKKQLLITLDQQYVPSLGNKVRGGKNDKAQMLSRRRQKSPTGAKHILQLPRILEFRPAIPPPDVHGRTHWPTGQEARGELVDFRGPEYVSEKRITLLVKKKEWG